MQRKDLCPFWFFRSMFSEEERFRETVIEELDQRPHKEGGDQGADAGQQTGESTDVITDQVAADSDKAKGPFPVFGDHNGNGVIDRHTQVGSDVAGKRQST